MKIPLEFQGVSFSYGRKRAVNSLSVLISPGEIVGLVGPNGAGKTTTLKLAAGLLFPDSGTISVFGEKPGKTTEQWSEIAFLPEKSEFFEDLTPFECLQFVASVQRLEIRETADTFLEIFRLKENADQPVASLSAGMRQKLSLILALLHHPKLLLLDEPLLNLDTVSISTFHAVLRGLASKGSAILCSSHMLHLLEESCSRFLVLSQGELIADGSLKELKNRFAAGDLSSILAQIFEREDSEARAARFLEALSRVKTHNGL